jgi:C-terminal processing protease CtpA/Prc
MGSARARLGLALTLLTACAGAPRSPSERAPEPLTRRVAEILAHHHISPFASPALLSARLFDQTRSALGCRQRASSALERERAQLSDAFERGELGFVVRAAAECGRPPPSPPQQLSLALSALARSYDPHSRYLPADALLRFHAQAHATGESEPSVRHELVQHLGRRIGLIQLPSFYLRAARSASADLRRACIELHAQGAEVLLLDLRGNGGGVQREAVLAFAVLAGAGPVGQLRRRDHRPETLSAPADMAAWRGALVVYVDGGTASVAELLAAALQDHGRARIIGQRSYGKGTGQTLIHLGSPRDPEQGAVDVSDRRFYRIDGRPLQREGVMPDIVLPAPELASERTRPGALLADYVDPVATAHSFREPHGQAALEALRAAIEYITRAP